MIVFVKKFWTPHGPNKTGRKNQHIELTYNLVVLTSLIFFCLVLNQFDYYTTSKEIFQ